MSQTLQEFISSWDGKPCEVAGSANAKNQCVDLANAYIRDVLGLPIIEWANAVDFPSRAGSSYDYILNVVGDDSVFPLPGDIVVLGKPYGKYIENGKIIYAGHIEICIKADGKTITAFSQNVPTGTFCHTITHDYNGVVGWLRKKGGKTMQIDNDLYVKLVTKSTNRDDLFTDLGVPLDPVEPKPTQALNSIKGLRDRITTVQRQLSEATTEVSNYKEKADRIQQTSDATAKTLQDRIDALEKAQKSFDIERESLKTQLENFAKDKGQLSLDLAQAQTRIAELQTKLDNALKGSVESLTFGDVVVLLWNKIRVIKLK